MNKLISTLDLVDLGEWHSQERSLGQARLAYKVGKFNDGILC